MRFLVDFFRWLFYGTPVKEGETAAAPSPESVIKADRAEPMAPKKPEMKVVDLRVLASPDDFLDELRSIRLGNDFVRDAKEDLLAELRRIASTSRRGSRKDAA